MLSNVKEARLLAASANALARHGPHCGPSAGEAFFYRLVRRVTCDRSSCDLCHPNRASLSEWAACRAPGKFAFGLSSRPFPIRQSRTGSASILCRPACSARSRLSLRPISCRFTRRRVVVRTRLVRSSMSSRTSGSCVTDESVTLPLRKKTWSH